METAFKVYSTWRHTQKLSLTVYMSFFTKKCTAWFHSLAHSIFWISPKPESTKQEWWFATSEDIQDWLRSQKYSEHWQPHQNKYKGWEHNYSQDKLINIKCPETTTKGTRYMQYMSNINCITLQSHIIKSYILTLEWIFQII